MEPKARIDNQGQKPTARARGWRQFIIGLIAYLVIVLAEGLFVDRSGLTPVLGVVLALLPMTAAVWGMLGWLDAIRTFDELQQKIFSEAGLMSLGVTAAVTFTYGFLETLLGAPRLSMFVVWPLIAASYLVTLPLTRRRYG